LRQASLARELRKPDRLETSGTAAAAKRNKKIGNTQHATPACKGMKVRAYVHTYGRSSLDDMEIDTSEERRIEMDVDTSEERRKEEEARSRPKARSIEC